MFKRSSYWARGAMAVALLAVGAATGVVISSAQGQQAGEKAMEKVTGIGGVFFKSADPKATMAWYRKHLGIDPFKMDGQDADFALFQWKELDRPDAVANTVWSPFTQDTAYFSPSATEFMVNYRVRNLDAMLAQLRAAGVKVVGEPTTEFNGRFGWFIDLDGRKVELWEPAAGF
ncbi:MAG: VOC family protein [Rhodospirillaceae bacterium]|nr:VOC family protein [Rhodospirillaceae bacterium]